MTGPAGGGGISTEPWRCSAGTSSQRRPAGAGGEQRSGEYAYACCVLEGATRVSGLGDEKRDGEADAGQRSQSDHHRPGGAVG